MQNSARWSRQIKSSKSPKADELILKHKLHQRATLTLDEIIWWHCSAVPSGGGGKEHTIQTAALWNVASFQTDRVGFSEKKSHGSPNFPSN